MTYATVRAATSPELAYLRTAGQWTKLYLAIFTPTTQYSARLSAVPSSNDRVVSVTFTGGSGTLANVRAGMMLYVGSTAGAYDLGVARIRKTPIAGTFYVGEESDIAWSTVVSGGIYLTVVNDFDLWAKHINTVSDTVFYMDYDVTYTDQNTVFDPIPIMGGHRVVKLTGSTVSTIFNFSNSYVIGSTISSYSCVAATASASSGMTTSTPTITFNTPGWHAIYLTVTAANGKTFTGVRFVYVYSAASMPSTVFQLGNCSVDYDTGGWSFEVTMQDEISLTNIPERAMCILFAEEYYGDTSVSIGQLAGCENIIAVGRIADEKININPEQSEITFRVQGWQHWFQQVYAFPTGVIATTTTPTDWDHMQSPTVDKVAFRLLHWGSNATQIMDVYLTNDTRLASELISPASNLWAQLQELAFATIQARTGVDRFGRLFVEVEPQLVPVASRTYATVMTITKADYYGSVNVDRVVVSPTGNVDLSGVVVDSSANGNSLYSYSPGHVFKHFGGTEIIDRFLLSTQALSNQITGLMLGWRNNPYPSSEFTLSANNRMVDCFPRQRVGWSIATGDSPRGFALSGFFIPRRVEFLWDAESNFLETGVTLEYESVEQISSNGDIPGSGTGDVSVPPAAPFSPDLPDFSSIILPIDAAGLGEAYPPKWIGHDTSHGFIYTIDFNSASPTYLSMNAGLSPTVDPNSANWIGVCPNGAIYVGRMSTDSGAGAGWLARASALGQPWSLVTVPSQSIWTAAINPTVPEQVGFLSRNASNVQTFHVGTYASFNTGVVIASSNFGGRPHSLSYFAPGGWLLTRFDFFTKINAAGTAITSSGTKTGIGLAHIRAGSTNLLYIETTNVGYSLDNLTTGVNNWATPTGINIVHDSSGIQYLQFDCDPTGRFIMTAVDSLGSKNKSSDYGATWASLASLPPGGSFWCFAYAGMRGTLPQFLAASSILRATPDFGSTWEEKTTSSLLAIAPFPRFNVHKFIGLVPYGNP